MTIRRILRAAWAALLLASPPVPAADPPRRDALGDPLPKRAVARIGTGRLRHAAMVEALAFSPDDRQLASAGRDNAVRLWDTATGKLLHDCRGHIPWPAAVAFSPDGKLLATADADNRLRFWDTATWKVQREATVSSRRETLGVLSAAFSADGRALAVAHCYAVQVWDVAAARWAVTLPGCAAFAISPDGKVLACAGFDHVIRLGDVKADKVARELRGHAGRVTDVLFSPDGRLLATGSTDHTILLWDVR